MATTTVPWITFNQIIYAFDFTTQAHTLLNDVLKQTGIQNSDAVGAIPANLMESLPDVLYSCDAIRRYHLISCDLLMMNH